MHRAVVIPVLLLFALFGPAGAADSFNRLSARDISARLPNHMVTDEAHWSDSFMPDGTLKALELGQLRLGAWRIKNGELCLTRKAKKEVVTECFEVWQSNDQVEYRRDGITIMEGVLRRQ
jgi:hypothetical protein